MNIPTEVNILYKKYTVENVDNLHDDTCDLYGQIHYITEVAIIRYNRIGSEVMVSHSVEGESSAYGDNDFSGFQNEIQAFIDSQSDMRKGRVF